MSLNETSVSKDRKLTLRWAWIVVATVITTIVPRQSSASIISLNTYSSVAVYATNGMGNQNSVERYLSGLNYDNDTVTTTYGASTSSVTLNWSTDNPGTGPGSYQVLGLEFEQVRGGNYSVTSQSIGTIIFKANQDAMYSFTGLYGLLGTGKISSFLQFTDDTAGTQLFRDENESLNVVNEQFVLGDKNDGNLSNLTAGSLTGNLIQGHQYRLHYSVLTQAYPSMDAGATASGFLGLEIQALSDTAVTPEPASLVLWGGMGLVGLVAMRRRKKDAGLELNSTPASS